VSRTLTITRGTTGIPEPGAIPFTVVRDWIRTGTILRHVFRYRDVRLQTQILELMPRPLVTALVVRALSRGRATIEDEYGRTQGIGPVLLTRLLRDAVRDWLQRGRVLADVRARLGRAAGRPVAAGTGLDRRPLYLRTDFVFGLASGGSVGHIAGVLNNLDSFAGPPVFATTDPIPTVRPDIETWVIRPDGRFRDFVEVPSLAFTARSSRLVKERLGRERPAFVYQRYCLNNFSGAELAAAWEVPFVLEYNGSEVWIQRHWGGTELKYRELSQRIEDHNFAAANLIVVVSEPMRTELLERGVDDRKILVNPNGVDVDIYRPDIDASDIRAALGLDGKLVLGFIGTFGPWHGAETLAAAWCRLLDRHPEHRETCRLLVIGDGDRFEATKAIIANGSSSSETSFVGRTRQEDGPRYLAACDILVSPHVPNPDGTRFFGSPTKLFEYMAMGRGIVASRLDQIGDVLEHDRTAWLVEPGDVDDLVEGMQQLIVDAERRARLGAAARRAAVERHTWREHTRRIVERIEALGA
jgi:glycosyltransferase involved in cell wall biosynthesis